MTEYKVVGIAESPEYFSLEDEPTTIGNGKLNLFVYVEDSAFALDCCTEIKALVKGAEGENAFEDAYQDKTDTAGYCSHPCDAPCSIGIPHANAGNAPAS